MTEAEWLACDDPERMYFFVTDEAAWPRQSRLLGCACARRLWQLLGPIYRTAIELAEGYEDGRVSAADLDRASETVTAAMYTDYLGDTGVELARIVVQMAAHREAPFPDLDKAASAFAWDAESEELDWYLAREREVAVQVSLVRDVFGNPFRPVALDPAWRTSDVIALARGVYDERAFDRLPILADALQDAGCDSADLLNHLREPGEHVRGCWALDLALGK